MKKLLLTLLLAVPAAALAQTTTDDGLSFGARAQVEADAKLASGLHLTAHEQVRYYFDSEDILRLHTGIGLEATGHASLTFSGAGEEAHTSHTITIDSL